MRWQHYLSYYGLKLFSGWLCSLPKANRDHLSVRIASFAYHILKLRKKDSLNNIKLAFPEKNKKLQFKLLKDVYYFFAKSFLQFMAFPRAYTPAVIRIQGQSLLDDGLKKGKGVILTTGHFGNWEILSAWLGYNRYPCVAVAHRQNNRGADIFFKKIRDRTGMKIIYKKTKLVNMYRLLEQNQILILGSDQDAKDRGVFVDFFNRPVSTPKGAARFHLQAGADILFITCHEEKNTHFQIEIEPVVPKGEYTVESITQAYTTLLEAKVRAFPEQYFWFHRRWKTRPN